MSNNIIDKIQISGQSYDVKDSSAATVVELTQQEYDDLPSSAKTGNTLFVITDAQAGDLTNYYTKTETNTLLNDKQATLVSGTNIKTINNTSILGSGNIDIQGGGGGKAVSGGTNISITTGDTADTINCTLPMSVGTGDYLLLFNNNTNGINSSSHYGFIFGSQNGIYNPIKSNEAFIIGNWNETTANSVFIHGHSCNAKGLRNFISGYKLNANYSEETAFGYWNNSVTGSTDADKTLFSVGNGTADNARHNAFEIRQNGDIYCSDGTNDVKLQDTITATAANTTALGGLKLVKLSQSEYDALATKDSNTLYIVTDS